MTFEEADLILYKANKQKEIETVWNEIKNNHKILSKACSIYVNKWGNTLFGSPDIVRMIILNAEDFDDELLTDLFNDILSYPEIASIIPGNDLEQGSGTTLLTYLVYKNFELNEQEKEFIVNQLLIKNSKHCYSTYDLAYYILRNDSFTLMEKGKLIYKYFELDQYWDDFINKLSIDLKNEFDLWELYSDLIHITYTELDQFITDKEKFEIILKEINFLKYLEEIRHTSFTINPKKLVKK